MMFRLVEQMSDKEGVTEQLKAENPMLWVVRMNEIQARAREIINREINQHKRLERQGEISVALFLPLTIRHNYYILYL